MAGGALDELLTTLDVRVHAVALCEVSRGSRLVFDPMSMVTVHYVLDGEGRMDVEGRGSAEFAPGSVLIVPPGGRVTLGLRGGDGRPVSSAESAASMADGLLVFRAGEDRPDLSIASGTITATYAGGFGLFDHVREPLTEDVSDLSFFGSAIDLLLQEVRSPGLASRAFTETLMRQCLLIVLRSHFARSGPDSPLLAGLRDSRLVRALRAVLAQPGARHTLQSLAAEAGMSRSVFSERFMQSFDQSPFEFVQKVRLRHAAHVLHATDLPVKLIAEAAGFASRSHFSRAFRVAYGCDPSAYRKMRTDVDAAAAPRAAGPFAIATGG